jgi:hypothetical protein
MGSQRSRWAHQAEGFKYATSVVSAWRHKIFTNLDTIKAAASRLQAAQAATTPIMTLLTRRAAAAACAAAALLCGPGPAAAQDDLPLFNAPGFALDTNLKTCFSINNIIIPFYALPACAPASCARHAHARAAAHYRGSLPDARPRAPCPCTLPRRQARASDAAPAIALHNAP